MLPSRLPYFVITAVSILSLALPNTGCESMEQGRGAKSILAVMQPPKPEDAVALALDEFDADKRYRGTAMLANAPFGGERPYLELFREAVEDEDAGVRQIGVRAIGIHGEPEDVPAITARLTDDEWLVRMEAARALQRLHNPDAVVPLTERTTNDNEIQAAVRAEAVLALGQYRQARVLQTLVTALADPSLSVNYNAVASLEILTGQNLGFEPAAWLAWIEEADDPFTAGRIYTYPGFERDKLWYEWIPFFGQPPNESDSVPVGLQPRFDS